MIKLTVIQWKGRLTLGILVNSKKEVFQNCSAFFVCVNSFEKRKIWRNKKVRPEGSKTKLYEKYLVEVLLTIGLTFVFTSTLLYSRLSYALGKIQRLSYQEQKGAHVGCSIILSPVNRDICNSHFSTYIFWNRAKLR